MLGNVVLGTATPLLLLSARLVFILSYHYTQPLNNLALWKPSPDPSFALQIPILIVKMPYLLPRDTLTEAKETLSSWDKCMAKSFCKSVIEHRTASPAS